MHEKIPQFDGMPIKTLCCCHSITRPISTPNEFLVYLFIVSIYVEYISMRTFNCYAQKGRAAQHTQSTSHLILIHLLMGGRERDGGGCYDVIEFSNPFVLRLEISSIIKRS